jgi:hypothetical protein
MKTQNEAAEMYRMIRENRMAMYGSPGRYFNREKEGGSSFRFLFLIEIMVFLMLAVASNSALAQEAVSSPIVMASGENLESNIHNYNAIYNSGKVFINWTAKNEPADCIYIIERSGDGQQFESVGVKEGIGTSVELFYSWMDHTPPAGFAYYRVKKIAKDGTQYYSATNAVINQGSSFNQKSNYAKGESQPAPASVK